MIMKLTFKNVTMVLNLVTPGAKGEAGKDGARGADGTIGADGADGKSTYDIWLAAGNTGTETDFLASITSAYQIWLDTGHTGTKADFIVSLKGDTGPQGIPGIAGTNGIDGVNGEQGAKGDTGEQGIQGLPGAGVAAGGTTGQALIKTNNTDFATEWESIYTATQIDTKFQEVAALPATPDADTFYFITE